MSQTAGSVPSVPSDPGVPSDPEDRKIITLATAARARTGAAQGGCLRDTDGRTYAGTSVALPQLSLTAIQVCLAMAVSSGAQGVEAVALSGGEPTEADRAALSAFAGSSAPILLVDPRGTLLATLGS